MKKFIIGELYYVEDSKSIVKILSEESGNYVFVESVFSDGYIREKGVKATCETRFLYNRVGKTIILSL